VASDPLASDDLMTIRRNLQLILGDGMSVAAMLADSPIVRPGGKIPLIIQSNAMKEQINLANNRESVPAIPA
jgi:hypothetical protein